MLDRLNIELHRLAKSVESSQDLVAKDNSLDTAIRASLLLDKILSSTEATVRALLTDDLRYLHHLGHGGYDISQGRAGLEITLLTPESSALSTRSQQVVSGCIFQLVLSCTYSATSSSVEETCSLSLPREKLNFQDRTRLWKCRIGLGIRAPFSTISLTVHIQAALDGTPQDARWHTVRCAPAQFGICSFVRKEPVLPKCPSPYIAKKRVVADVCGRAASPPRSRSFMIFLPLVKIFGDDAVDPGKFLLGKGYEERWVTTENVTTMTAKSFACNGASLTLTFEKRPQFGQFEQRVEVVSDCFETARAMTLHLREAFCKRMKESAPRQLDGISPRVFNLAKNAPAVSERLAKLEQDLCSSSKDGFNPFTNMDILQRVQRIYEDFYDCSSV